MPDSPFSFTAATPLRIALVGGGAGAREFVIRFMNSGAEEIPTVFDVFEPRDVLGRGIAWSAEVTPVLANMRIETLGPDYPDFDLIKTILTDLGDPEANSEYPTRNAVGRALDERWRRVTVKWPAQWAPIRHIRAAASDIVWNGSTALIMTEVEGEYQGYHYVILALGNLSERPAKNFVNNARYIDGWNVEGIEAIPPESDVFIKGAGLTAIDATLRLLRKGERQAGSIVWQSQTGGLPFVRPRQLKLNPVRVTYAAIQNLIRSAQRKRRTLDLSFIWTVFELEMKSQAVQQAGKYAPGTDFDGFVAMQHRFENNSAVGDFLEYGIRGADSPSLWFSVAKHFDEYIIPLLWNAISDEEKALFLRDWRRAFDRFWAPIPVTNGRRVQQWIADGIVQLVRGTIPDDQYQTDQTSGKILFDAKLEDPLRLAGKEDLQDRYAEGFDFFINAGGIPSNLSNLDSKLVANLYEAGILVDHKLLQSDGVRHYYLGAQIDWYTGAVSDGKGGIHSWLYTLTGSLTSGAHRFTNSYMAVSLSAERAAADLVERLLL